jgi:hypothetical protein
MVKPQRSAAATTGSVRSEASSTSGIAASFQRSVRMRMAGSEVRSAMESAVLSMM